MQIEPALHALEAGFERTLADLVDLSRIPSVSAAGFDPAQVVRSAERVAALLEGSGLAGVELLRVGKAHPYGVRRVAGRGPEGADAPALRAPRRAAAGPRRALAHAALRADRARRRPALRPRRRRRQGGHRRCTSRRSPRGWAAQGTLPVNVKLLVEGEEEIGSRHLARVPARAPRAASPPTCIVLTDTANFDDRPPVAHGSLRGLVASTSRCARSIIPLHCGMWGGPLPDPRSALGTILARSPTTSGAIAMPGITTTCRPLSAAERAALARAAVRRGEFRRDAGLLAGVPLSGERGRSVYEQIWRRPVARRDGARGDAAPEAREPDRRRGAGAGRHAARPRTWTRSSATRRSSRTSRRIRRWGVQRRPIEAEGASPGWLTEPVGPAFDAARRALHAGFGRDAGRDRLRRLDPVRRPLRRGARRRARAAHRSRGPARATRTARTRACISATSGRPRAPRSTSSRSFPPRSCRPVRCNQRRVRAGRERLPFRHGQQIRQRSLRRPHQDLHRARRARRLPARRRARRGPGRLAPLLDQGAPRSVPAERRRLRRRTRTHVKGSRRTTRRKAGEVEIPFMPGPRRAAGLHRRARGRRPGGDALGA